ncbi:MAG: hypothetical protein R3285_02270 [Kiloniellales bacterium]|nr:hypothetical protein [Kiloniellales bacterium]
MLVLSSLAWSSAVLAAPLDFDPDSIAWSRLEFRPTARPDDLSVEVQLSEASPDEISLPLPSEPGAGPAAALLQMISTIDVAFTGRTYRTDVWFSAAGVSPLERRRDKIGKGANRKIYRYLDDGVRRLRIEPDGRSQAKLPPDDWTQVQELFFPYGPGRADCAVLSDPNLLFVIASAGAVTGAPLELCVFNKQAIYRVRLSAEPGRTLEADYREIRGAEQVQVRRRAPVRKIRIQAFRPDVDGIEADPFEFFEMRGEIEIDLDADSRLPLRVSGDIGSRRVEFQLSEVAWRS